MRRLTMRRLLMTAAWLSAAVFAILLIRTESGEPDRERTAFEPVPAEVMPSRPVLEPEAGRARRIALWVDLSLPPGTRAVVCIIVPPEFQLAPFMPGCYIDLAVETVQGGVPTLEVVATDLKVLAWGMTDPGYRDPTKRSGMPLTLAVPLENIPNVRSAVDRGDLRALGGRRQPDITEIDTPALN
jgi:hypothetical protein